MLDRPTLPFPLSAAPKPEAREAKQTMTESDFVMAAEHGGSLYAQQLRLAQKTGYPAFSPNA